MDLIIPVTMIIVGLVYKKHPPKKINRLHGYRTEQSMKSQEAWDYAHKHFFKLWFTIGILLGICIVISKLIFPIAPQYLSLIHTGISIVALIVPIPIIEVKLKKLDN
jgi:uncharacterized membrane protein